MPAKKTLFKLVLFCSLAVAAFSQAGYLELFEKEFMTNPWGGGRHQISACVECHSSTNMEPAMHAIVDEWQQSWHAKNEVSCHDCHGGGQDDSTMAMSHDRGFVGTPTHQQVPEFCGKCHIGILKNYIESGHGQSLMSTDSGPNCVTCHGSHNIQPASIAIINEEHCTQCHSYDRAKEMRQALSTIENKLTSVRNNLDGLQAAGVILDDEKKAFFRAHADFRTLFHTIDTGLVLEKSDEFLQRLNVIDAKTQEAFAELSFRKNFSGAMLLLFATLLLTTFYLIKSYDYDKGNLGESK